MSRMVLKTGCTKDGVLDFSIWKIERDDGKTYFEVGNMKWGFIWTFNALEDAERQFDCLCSKETYTPIKDCYIYPQYP